MAWQHDYASLVESLRMWTLEGEIPARDELVKKYEQDLFKSFTDGAGGFFDLSPLPGTLQFRVNDYYSGRMVSWRLRPACDTFRDIGQQQLYEQLNFQTGTIFYLIPAAPNAAGNSSDGLLEYSVGLALIVQQSPDGDIDGLKAGEECLLSGRIEDARHTSMFGFSGVNVAYHFDTPISHNIYYMVQVSNAHITRPQR